MANVMPGFLTASLAPRIRADFAFSESTLGLAIALFYVVSAASSVPAGRLVDRIGDAWGVWLSALLTAIAGVGIALLADSAVSHTAFLLVGGVGNALGTPAVSVLLKREVAVRRQGVAFGAQQSGAPIGALLAGLALPAVAIPFGWRWAFAIAAVLALLTVALIPRPAPGSHAHAVGDGRPPRGFTSVHALAVAAALASAATLSFVAFLVTYSVDSGMSETAAGLLLAAVSLLSTICRIAFGLATDRAGADPLRPIALMLAISAPGFLLLIAGVPVLIAIAALLVGGVGWAWVGALAQAVIARAPSAPAWAVSVMMTGLFAGAIGGPIAIGFLAEHDLFELAWIACACLALMSAAMLMATLRREGARP